MMVRFTGLDGVTRALSIARESIDADDMRVVFDGFIRPTEAPGGIGKIMANDGMTLEGQARLAFANEGSTPLRGKWAAYGDEPRYAEYKDERGGGRKVGTWDGSQRPLSETFTNPDDPDHIESNDGVDMNWGSRRAYAGGFHEGGRWQRWDQTRNPARHVIEINTKLGREHARGVLRYMAGKLKSQGRTMQSVRVVVP